MAKPGKEVFRRIKLEVSSNDLHRKKKSPVFDTCKRPSEAFGRRNPPTPDDPISPEN